MPGKFDEGASNRRKKETVICIEYFVQCTFIIEVSDQNWIMIASDKRLQIATTACIAKPADCL